MSRTWSSCAVPRKCGRCGRRIAFNEPMCSVHPDPVHALKARFIRCAACAGEPVPPNLPPAVANRGVPIEPRQLERRGQPGLPLDYKAIAAGDREPGSDD